jgi:hypothetical protein
MNDAIVTYRTMDNAVFTFAMPANVMQWVKRPDELWDMKLTTHVGGGALAIGVEDQDAATDEYLRQVERGHVDMRSAGSGEVFAEHIIRPTDSETATITNIGK